MSETKRFSLYPACGACPEVILHQRKGEVLIGEEGNFSKLNEEAWNTLVEKFLTGEVARL